jgi:hypothetical protein
MTQVFDFVFPFRGVPVGASVCPESEALEDVDEANGEVEGEGVSAADQG